MVTVVFKTNKLYHQASVSKCKFECTFYHSAKQIPQSSNNKKNTQSCENMKAPEELGLWI